MRTERPLLLATLGLLLCAPQLLRAQSGTLDPTFNATGYVVNPVNSGDNLQKILVQDDQKILTIGMSWDAGFIAKAYVFRYNPDGTLDTDFADNGMFVYEQDFEALLYSGMITDEGKILLVGATTDYQTYRMMLIQLNEDGSLDDGFGTNGVVLQVITQVPQFGEDFAYNVAQDADGGILVCGSSHDPNYVRRPIVVRFTADGDLDTSFGVDGVASVPVMAVGASAFKCLRVQPDGKIIAAGYFGETELWYTLLLARFNADGTLDDTFSGDGIVRHSYGNVDDLAQDIQLTDDGSIIVAGRTVTVTYNYSALLMKFTAEGEVDDSFGDSGAVEEDLDNFDYSWSLAVQADGRIVMAGTSGVGPPDGFDLAVWKYTANGAPDASFGTNGLAHFAIPDYYTMIYGMALQADGKILIGGQARTPINQNYFFVARLTNDVNTGIAEAYPVNPVVALPNPAAAGAWITLRSDRLVDADARIALVSADGKRVCSYAGSLLHRDGAYVSLQLPTEVAPGAYHVSIEQQGTRSATTIVVTH